MSDTIGIDDHRVVSEDLSSGQYLCLKFKSDGTCAKATSSDTVFGVLQNNTDINESGTIRLFGTSYAIAGNISTAIDQGDLLKIDPSNPGKVIQDSSPSFLTTFAMALGTASAMNEEVLIKFPIG